MITLSSEKTLRACRVEGVTQDAYIVALKFEVYRDKQVLLEEFLGLLERDQK